jgi:hypothetical protein
MSLFVAPFTGKDAKLFLNEVAKFNRGFTRRERLIELMTCGAISLSNKYLGEINNIKTNRS